MPKLKINDLDKLAVDSLTAVADTIEHDPSFRHLGLDKEDAEALRAIHKRIYTAWEANEGPLYDLVREVVEAVRKYDLTSDHCKHNGGADCIRCAIVKALPEWCRK